MKIATHVLLFGQDKWIMRNIENAYPHVDKIYIAHSTLPWTYNPNARNQYVDTFDINIILNSNFNDKVVIINGVWDTEEDQRNACVQRANDDRMDYLIIHDADEFYFHNHFENIKKFILKYPDFDLYKIPWRCFWKTFKNVLLTPTLDEITGYPEFCINLKKHVRFQSKRRPFIPNIMRIQTVVIPEDVGVCYHGSYVLTNEELLQKINTWGHVNDFDKERWYNEKWLLWTSETKNLHLVTPCDWSMAAPFNNELPEVISDLK